METLCVGNLGMLTEGYQNLLLEQDRRADHLLPESAIQQEGGVLNIRYETEDIWSYRDDGKLWSVVVAEGGVVNEN